MNNKLRIIYMGDGKWAHQGFENIRSHGHFSIKKVILRNNSADEILKEKAEQAGIEVLCPNNINNPDFIDYIEACEPDLGISMSYNQIIKRNLMCVFPRGIINCHAGKLPEYRGRNILNWALINGEQEIGVTCHYIDEGIDTGDIILQKTFPVNLDDDYGSVLEKAQKLCPEVLIEAMDHIYNGQAERRPQPKAGSYFIARKVGDEFIDWSWESERIYNFVRAITTPGPCARSWVQMENDVAHVIIKKTKMLPEAATYHCIEGGVVGKSDLGNPLVKTGDTMIELLEYKINHEDKTDLKTGDRLGINQHLQMLNRHKKSRYERL